jgi:hypothetical protein
MLWANLVCGGGVNQLRHGELFQPAQTLKGRGVNHLDFTGGEVNVAMD